MEWRELDSWGRETGKTFVGRVEEVMTHLRGIVPRDGRVEEPVVTEVLLNRVGELTNERRRVSMVVLRLPWGVYRWIAWRRRP